MSRTIHLSNGIIVIQPSSSSIAHSLTITDGRVVGHNQPCPVDAKHIDLNSRCALPAFIDSHMHLLLSATGKGEIDLKECTSKQEFEHQLLQGYLHLVEGQWLVCSGWSESTLHQHPTIEWIPEEIHVPVICYKDDFHAALVNKVLVEELECDQLRLMPGGGSIDNGIVMEDALFEGVIPRIPPPNFHNQLRCLERAVAELHSQGITLVGSMEHLKDVESILSKLQNNRSIRVRVMCVDEPTEELIQRCNKIMQDDFLRITGFKSFLDGTLGSRSAKMYADWNDVAGNGVWAGHAAKNALDDWVERVSCAGFAPVLHAIGDEAVGLALCVIKDIDASLVPRIEHAQCISENDLHHLEGKWFGVQPLHQPSDSKIASRALGAGRSNELHNWRRMIDAGAKLSFGSDWPIAPPKPIKSMAIAISQGLSPAEALEASTYHGAKSLRCSSAGHLEIGAYGDVAILDKNPLTADWHNCTPSVTMTIQNGVIVYKKETQHE